MSSFSDVGVIGAGPYGLSVAAHLLARGLKVKVFGSVMQTWREAMPADMMLKSEGFASSLSDPEGKFTLKTFCAERGIPYKDVNLPVRVKTFIAYGEAFQQRFVPDLERRHVTSVKRIEGGFELQVEGGDVFRARRVVVASGIRQYDYLPPELADIPADLLSHSNKFGDITHLKDRHVAVIGAGSSAMDLAALLRRQGSRVTVIARRSKVFFQEPLGERSLWERIRAPMTGLGPGWKSVLCVRAPFLFACMPKSFRIEVARRYLGPAPSWFSRADVEGKVDIISGASILGVGRKDGGAEVTVKTAEGVRQIQADHVIAATGYRVDLSRLAFLDSSIQSALQRTGLAPKLSMGFESSVPGLYFVGTAAANTFGPLVRFVYGSDFVARHVARRLSAELAPQRREQAGPAIQPAEA